MSSDEIVFYQLNGILLSLYPRDELAKDATVDPAGNGFKGFTLAYNTRSEQEVDEPVDAVKAPQKVFWGGYSSCISDPDGNLWEIASK